VSREKSTPQRKEVETLATTAQSAARDCLPPGPSQTNPLDFRCPSLVSKGSEDGKNGLAGWPGPGVVGSRDGAGGVRVDNQVSEIALLPVVSLRTSSIAVISASYGTEPGIFPSEESRR
jgi:hypothetical protein